MSVRDWRVLREVPVTFARMGMMLSQYWESERRRDRIKLLLKIRSERDLMMLPAEACQIMSLIQAVKNVSGDMAELGVASGASSKMISSCAPERTLHLFDTFEGLPERSAKDNPRFRGNQYRFSLEGAQDYLKGRNVRFYKGLFPQTTKAVPESARFAFVHLDGDLYESTLAGLQFFYPRMNRGGIIISHEFDTSIGVNRAFEEFFADKPEPYFDLVGSQCMFDKM
jgi:O-methyltransferase